MYQSVFLISIATNVVSGEDQFMNMWTEEEAKTPIPYLCNRRSEATSTTHTNWRLALGTLGDLEHRLCGNPPIFRKP